MIAGACALFVLAGGIATAAALDGGGHKKVVVANPTTTTGPDTTVPATTTIPRVTTTTIRKASPKLPLHERRALDHLDHCSRTTRATSRR